MKAERLRQLYGDVSPRAARKSIASFDQHCRAFIDQSTFAILATSDGSHLDISPKGDPAGFVDVESDTTLLLPDRPGNNRLDSLLNIIANPGVAMLFMIPTVAETLRVNGGAEILEDPEICDRFKVRGRAPKTVLRINAEEIFVHCGKAPVRAGLWQPDLWPAQRPVPTLYEMVRDHAEMEIDGVDQHAVDASYERSLY